MAATIFIDGEAGTTGLQIREKLARASGVELVSLPPEARKDASAKQKLYAQADVVILCLPDEAAKEAAHLIEAMGSSAPRVIDASSAHRVAPGWTYGFPELVKGQGEAIAKANKVANPGCHATGAIAILRPLVDAGLIAKDACLSIGSVSGYSGGGKSMIESYESGRAPAFELYALTLEHKHMAEIQLYSGLTARPIFAPSVGNFRQGMLVSVPLHLDALPGKPKGADLSAAFERALSRPAAFPHRQAQRRRPDRTGVAQRHERHRNSRLRQRDAASGAPRRQVRQPRQGRVRRRGAEFDVDARAGRIESRMNSLGSHEADDRAHDGLQNEAGEIGQRRAEQRPRAKPFPSCPRRKRRRRR